MSLATNSETRTEADRPGPAAVSPPPSARAGVPRSMLGALGLALFFGIWELLPRIGVVAERHLPPATEVALTLAERAVHSDFWVAVGQTVLAAGLGLAIACGAAVTLGFTLGSLPRVRAYTTSTVEFLRPIPSVALIPLAILLYGTDLGSPLLLVVYAAFWQIYIQVLYGVADIDPVAEQTARSYQLGRLSRFRHVTWPAALPYVLTGVRLGAAVALILAVTAQLVIGSPGLGQEIARAQQGGAVELTYALIVATGVLGVCINVGVRSLERRALHWHTSVRGEAPV